LGVPGDPDNGEQRAAAASNKGLIFLPVIMTVFS